MHKNVKRFLPFTLLLFLIGLLYLTNFYHLISLETLRQKHAHLLHFLQKHPISSHFLYVGFYLFSVCLIIPDSSILTLLGGLVFPLPLAIFYSVFCETVGAFIFFVIFSTIFGSGWIEYERPFLYKLRKGFQQNSASYLLFLRFSHLLPFWFINLTAAYFKVHSKTFIWTTLIGVIPLSIILGNAGHSLSKTFAKDTPLHMGDLFTVEMKISLLFLGLLALIPIVYKKWIKKK